MIWHHNVAQATRVKPSLFSVNILIKKDRVVGFQMNGLR